MNETLKDIVKRLRDAADRIQNLPSRRQGNELLLEVLGELNSTDAALRYSAGILIRRALPNENR